MSTDTTATLPGDASSAAVLGRHPAPGDAFIDADALESSMQALFERCDPQVGILGPDTMSWEVYSQKVVWFGAARCNMLQSTHPAVAAALVNKSTADTSTRLETTIAFVDGVVFGTLDQARELAEMLHTKHMAVSGTLDAPAGEFVAGDPYEGNDVEALWWVLATMIDTTVMMYSMFLRPMTDAEKDRLIAELPILGAMFGIPASALPADWAEFKAYFRAMLAAPRTEVRADGLAAAQNILQIKGFNPMMRLVRAMTIEWLPPAVRAAYEINFDLKTRMTSKLGHAFVRVWWALQTRRSRRAQSFIDARLRLGLPPVP